MAEDIHNYIHRRLENLEGSLTVPEIQTLVEQIQYRAVSYDLEDVGNRNFISAVDDLCRMIIWLCDDTGHKEKQEYLTGKLAAAAHALNV